MDTLSLAAARRIALAAQGFGEKRPEAVTKRHLLRNLDRLHLHQIDSVNVLVRAHYLPAFSHLGPYDRGLLDQMAWGKKRHRKLFEYWAHEASLLPFDLHPLLRWRMAAADRGEIGWNSLRLFAKERRPEAEAILARIRAEGAMSASDLERSLLKAGLPAKARQGGGWWEWGHTKQAVEWLFWAGHITTQSRRGSFERVYDLTERVIPAEVLARPTPDRTEAHRALIDRAARALGVAAATDLRDYFRLAPEPARAAIAELVEEGALIPTAVEGWRQTAFVHCDARRARRIRGQALLAPFDPLVWERSRAERLFGFRYRIEIYTPAEKRVHGYYVLPFLMDERLAARVDLKADRAAGKLAVRNVVLEPDAPAQTNERLRQELESMAEWLGLERLDA